VWYTFFILRIVPVISTSMRKIHSVNRVSFERWIYGGVIHSEGEMLRCLS
jgi:hypothetical protein